MRYSERRHHVAVAIGTPRGRHLGSLATSHVMNCFHHPSTTAVGICRTCGRGLCSDCAFAGGDMLTCRGRCEMIAKQMIGGMSFSDRSMPVFTVLIAFGGAGMIIASIDFTAKTISPGVFVGAAMILIAVFLWFMFRSSRRSAGSCYTWRRSLSNNEAKVIVAAAQTATHTSAGA